MTTYRPDIDGLRAICIVSVVMFHGQFKDWSGGFVGVDIFFVISGFLITSLIVRQMTLGEFSLFGFYERRVRRLLAATIPVVLFTTLFALVFYATRDIVTYCKSLISFIGYGSNWFFLGQTGYFATPSSASPLLHTWSLGVEEQFYLVFPAVLLALLRFPRAVTWVLAALAAVSFAYAEFEIRRGFLDRAFFSSFSRFWELLAGALLAVMPALIKKTARVALPMRAIGLAMIAASVFLYGSGMPFPGVAALLPVSGALLLIAASPARCDPVWKLLTAPPLAYLGKISYSLYLWHWPLLGATRLLEFDESEIHTWIAIALSVVLAALSYHLVEQPIRTRRKLARGRNMAVLLATTSVIGLTVGSSGWATGGWPTRSSSRVEAMLQRAGEQSDLPGECFEFLRDGPRDRALCTFGNAAQGKADLLLWGDSHARSLFSAVRKYAEVRGLSLAIAGRAGCPPLFEMAMRQRRGSQGCRELSGLVKAFIRENNVSAVILAGRWSMYANDSKGRLVDLQGISGRTTTREVLGNAMRHTLDELRDQAIVIVEQVPEQKIRILSSYLVLIRLGGSLDTVRVDRTMHVRHQRAVVEVLDRTTSRDNILRIDPARVLCDSGTCIAKADENLLYFDEDHLNIDGSLFLYPLIERELDRFLATRRLGQK